jgi:hypothetical protein
VKQGSTVRALGVALALTVLVLTVRPAAAAQLKTPHFIFETDDIGLSTARQLAEKADCNLTNRHSRCYLKTIAGQLGARPYTQPPITVYVLRGQDAFKNALKERYVPPEWTAGLAIPSQRLIYLKIDAKTHFSLHDIFRHEISHVVLHAAAGGRHLPLWFVEGVAVNQAGEQLRQRWYKTAQTTLGGGPLPFESLNSSFPSNPVSVDLAYAQSSAFVGHLIRKGHWISIRGLIRRVKQGVSFSVAFYQSYGATQRELETRWLKDLESSASWIPFLTAEGLLWVIIAILFILAYLVHRRRQRAKLAAMDDPEPNPDDEFA